MKKLLPAISVLALLGIIVPPVLYLLGHTGKPLMGQVMLAATILWFATVPFWMDKKR